MRHALVALCLLAAPAGAQEPTPRAIVEVFAPAGPEIALAMEAVRGSAEGVAILHYDPGADPANADRMAIYSRQLGVEARVPFWVVDGATALAAPDPAAVARAIEERPLAPMRLAAGNRGEFHGLVVDYEVSEIPEGAYLFAALVEDGRVRSHQMIRLGEDRKGTIEFAPPEGVRPLAVRVVAFVQVPPGMAITAAASAPWLHASR